MPTLNSIHDVRLLLLRRIAGALHEALFYDVEDEEREEAQDACEDLAALCLESMLLEVVSIDPDVRASALIELQDSPVEV